MPSPASPSATLWLGRSRRRAFTYDGTIELADRTETAEIDYVAPDRLRSIEHGESGSTTRIIIGTDSYVSPASGYPFTVSHISDFSVAELISPLGALQTADDVRLVDGSYRFTISDSIGQLAGEGEARVQGGVLESVSLNFGKIDVRFTFSDYGRDFVINAPNMAAAAS